VPQWRRPMRGESVGDEAAEGLLKVKLADGTLILINVKVTKVEEIGFSPYGGVMFNAWFTISVTTYEWPDELKEKVRDRPVYYQWQELPKDGWELVDIEWQEPSVIETTVDSSRGTFNVRFISRASMASRNLGYRVPQGGPLYSVLVVNEITWRPARATIGVRKGSVESASPDSLTRIYRVN